MIWMTSWLFWTSCETSVGYTKGWLGAFFKRPILATAIIIYNSAVSYTWSVFISSSEF